jgi:hypothetical protein
VTWIEPPGEVTQFLSLRPSRTWNRRGLCLTEAVYNPGRSPNFCLLGLAAPSFAIHLLCFLWAA